MKHLKKLEAGYQECKKAEVALVQQNNDVNKHAWQTLWVLFLCPNGGGYYEMENIPVPARTGQQTGAPTMLLL